MNRNKWFVRFCVAFVKVTGAIPSLLFLKPQVKLAPGAKRHLPAPCILVSNHISLMDFVLYLLVFPFRTIRFLMAEVLFNKGKLFSKFLFAIGGIRVDRDDMNFGFVSDAIEVLDQGGTIGVFPQARLSPDGSILPFTVSTAFIASHADAPIVPVFTDGSYGLTKRANVVIGAPFNLMEHRLEGLDEQAQLEHLTKVLQQKVYDLEALLK